MSAYYNEFDPKAAAWLRELIARGLVADGIVDERSILEVEPADLAGFTQCHFFAGIGGWSYALRLAGWPDDRSVWTGSPPCQPFSAAGSRKGKDDERHLAPHFIELVAACRPPVLFGEQVASAAVFGKVAKRARIPTESDAAPEWAWFDDLSDRLEAARYAVGASDLPAASVGAPHIRQRTFFGAISEERMADDIGTGLQRRLPRRSHPEREAEHGHAGRNGAVGGLDDTASGGEQRNEGRRGERTDPGARGRLFFPDGAEPSGGLADRAGRGRGEEHAVAGGRGPGNGAEGWPAGPNGGGTSGGLAGAEHAFGRAFSQRRENGRDRTHGRREEAHGEPGTRGEVFGLADDDDDERRGETRGGGLPAREGKRPERDGDVGRAGAPDGPWGSPDWLFCRDGKWRPVEPGTFPLAHGVPARVGRLRGYGNAIVPQAAARFIEAFDDAVAGTGGVRVMPGMQTDMEDIFG